GGRTTCSTSCVQGTFKELNRAGQITSLFHQSGQVDLGGSQHPAVPHLSSRLHRLLVRLGRALMIARTPLGGGQRRAHQSGKTLTPQLSRTLVAPFESFKRFALSFQKRQAQTTVGKSF